MRFSVPAICALAIASFTPLLPTPSALALITYVDATDGPSGNTTLLDGSVWEITSTATVAADGLWSRRAFSNGATIYESLVPSGSPPEDAHMLKTTITGLTPGSQYNLYGYFWSSGTTGDWRLEGTINPGDIDDGGTPGDPLDDSLPPMPGVSFSRMAGNPDTTLAPPAIPARFDSNLIFAEDGRTFYEAPFGVGTANASGEIAVYIDDWENPDRIRTWYDGVGFEALGTPTLTINRETGEMTYTSATPRNIAGYSIQSAAGTLSQADWLSITDRYDATATGPQAGLIDGNDSWVKLSDPASTTDLSEAELNLTGPLDGGVLPANTPISFGTAWRKYIDEELTMDLLLNDAEGTVEPVKIEFIGNGGLGFVLGDFSFDGDIGPSDFALFIDSLFTPIEGDFIGTYAQGDVNGDLVVDYADLVEFRNIYNTANGAGSFQALLAAQSTVPEPHSLALLLMGSVMAAVWCVARRQSRLTLVLARRAAAIVCCSAIGCATASAQIVYVDAVPNNVDATVNPEPNTTLLGGSPWGAIAATATSDNLYRYRTSAAWGNDGIYESNVGGAENSPILVTTVTGLDPSARYLTYGLFWSNPNENWHLKATNNPADIQNNGTPGDPLDDFLPEVPGIAFNVLGSATITAAPPVAASEFTDTVVVGTNPILYKAELGVHSPDAGGNLRYYIDDTAVAASTSRTWYDGVGHQKVVELVLEVNSVSGVASLKNTSNEEIDLSYYKITSDGKLNTSGWSTLDGQNYDAADGLDPGDIAGDSQLEGWDMAGGSDASLLSEVNFLGVSSIAPGAILPLGQAFLTGVTEGVVFEYESQQGLIPGLVEYVNTVPVVGDYDGNGMVDADDYTKWKMQYGQSGAGLAADGNSDGTVDAADYLVWRNSLSAPGSLTVAQASVPEPASVVGLALLAVVGLALRCKGRSRGVAVALLVATFGLLVAPNALAQLQLDREYRLGDDELEGSGEGVGVGTNNTGGLAPGNSADSSGPTGAYIDLEKGGTPTYTAVAGVGGGHPLAAPGSFGIRFNGTTDYLSGVPLNRPDELAQILANSSNPSVYPLNYAGITRRGMQMWVYPDQAGIDAGGFQSIVSDSIHAGGPAINEQGQWTQMSSRHFANIATGPEAFAPVTGNTWHHVMQHISVEGDANAPKAVAGSGVIAQFNSVVYVNGIAVSANNDSVEFTRDYVGDPPIVAGNPQPDYDHKLVIGGSELPNPEAAGPILYGNFFDGVIDDVEMYIYGDGTAQGGQNWGGFDLFKDNAWIKNQIDTSPSLQGTLDNGDLNRDGNIDQADIDAFVDGWLSRKEFQGAHSRLTAGDWETWTWGDMDHDGVVYLKDLSLMHKALAGAGLGGFDVSLLYGQAGTTVPEPGTLALFAGGLAAAACHLGRTRRRRRR